MSDDREGGRPPFELRTRFLGQRLLRFDAIDSTSAEAARQAADGADEGLVVVAAEQTEGRGRFGRRWHSPRGGLWFSVLLRPRPDSDARKLLPLAAGVALCRAVRETADLEPAIRWPNDLLLRGRKLAGILCEVSAPEALVLGIGVNVAVDTDRFPGDVARRSVSIAAAGGRVPGSIELLVAFLNAFEPVYFALGDPVERASLVVEARRRMSGLGTVVSISLPGGRERLEVRAVDLEPDGALLIETPDGARRKILSGDLEVDA